ncbi:hypothetical protein KUTeg_011080 [Tegillarca granosa]|uniref:Mab-21-like HhH/H2TH-like domain-containing protein n=1 Tax=Tegillarca granosa TaxID=220873 RepID=A0ABQ9F637_TEGGR|nr:hypothetical protein KUTeg_011080 [Tegillarca granosa]
MENFSSRLWTHLSVILGTEEEVYIRRRIFALANSINKHLDKFRVIYCGSRAEGLSQPESDIDQMDVNGNISVSENPTDLDIDKVMITRDIKPGFGKLRRSNSQKNKLYFGDGLIQTQDGLFLSSSFSRDDFLRQMLNHFPCAVAHGPCLSIQERLTVDLDILRCFSCKWPQIASEWIDRRRHYGWPSSDLIQDIVQDGCLLISIGNPNSHEVHSFNHTQFLCYGLLKLFLTHAINSNTQVKDLLCSYFLKTSLFYCIEEENIAWNKENLLDCFWTCLRRLLKWIWDEYCPNYFIKDNNVFEGKICGSNSKPYSMLISGSNFS